MYYSILFIILVVIVVQVSSYHQAFSEELHGFCTNPNIPICIVRRLDEVTRFG